MDVKSIEQCPGWDNLTFSGGHNFVAYINKHLQGQALYS